MPATRTPTETKARREMELIAYACWETEQDRNVNTDAPTYRALLAAVSTIRQIATTYLDETALPTDNANSALHFTE